MTILEALRAIGPGEFAFWIGIKKNLVYWARPQTVGAAMWPSEVCLLQGLCDLEKNSLFGSEVFVWKNGRAVTADTMGQGMADHLGVRIVDAEHLVAELPESAQYHFHTIEGQDIVRRKREHALALPDWPLADVDLRAQGSHLHRLYLAAAFRLIRLKTRRRRDAWGAFKRAAGHNIAALLVGRNGQVLAMALNTSSLNKTFHAEVNALQAFATTGSFFPCETFLYTTLKPCLMCAAMITQLLPDCTVFYAQDDPKAQGGARPTGGMRLLSDDRNAKQLKLLNENLDKTPRLLISELKKKTESKQRNKKQGEHHFYLTNVVDHEEMFELMDSGQRHLEHKTRKYRQSEIERQGVKEGPLPTWNVRRPEILRVLEHLSPLLNLNYEITQPPPRQNPFFQGPEPQAHGGPVELIEKGKEEEEEEAGEEIVGVGLVPCLICQHAGDPASMAPLDTGGHLCEVCLNASLGLSAVASPPS